jgi:hypothetical protein
VLPPVHRKEIALLGVILKQFENADEVRVFDKGKFEIVHIGGMTIGRASYEPGWKWSEHVAPVAGAPRCVIEHVRMVVSGRAMAAFEDGTEIEIVPGHLFYIPPIPHDSWVIGEEPMSRCISSGQTTTPSSAKIRGPETLIMFDVKHGSCAEPLCARQNTCKIPRLPYLVLRDSPSGAPAEL